MPVPRFLLINNDDDELIILERAIVREFPSSAIWKSHSAGEALAILADQPVDAVVTGNRMPSLDGVETDRLIRARDHRTPILLLTSSERKKSAAFAAGATDFLASGSWDDIRRHVRELMQPGVVA